MNKLTEYREKLNLTQSELATKSGLSVRTIQRIEAGATLKGHSLNALSQALNIPIEKFIEAENESSLNYKLIKLINLSSLPFVIVPLANIAIPLLIMYGKKEVNDMTKKIVSVQILWSILSAIFFLLSPFIGKLISLQNSLVLIVMIVSVLVNIGIILINTISLDENNSLRIKLKFNFL